jgi:hypothetical protein|tara:strand:- start:405 stop:1088 length:684 start_codon:yes stop_codon:yes gene_type:complete
MKKLLLGFLKFGYNTLFVPVVKKGNSFISSKIPKTELSKIHVNNAKLLTTREELLSLLPMGGVVAELGVDQGDFSESILNITKPQKLHLIDSWGDKRYNQKKRKSVENRFFKEVKENSIEINIGLSTEVVTNFKDNYFDWIYIDTTHSYKTTIEELEAYRTKIKPNGYITGHDFILGNWDDLVRYGVIEAVYEFCVKYDWEVLYITTEIENNPSFAIRRISRETSKN